MKVATIVGARPQFIKAAPVSRAVRAHHDEVLIHTGQHYADDMSDVFFRELQIPAPTHHLGVGSASHGVQTGRMLERIETTLQQERPDCVLVFGDTNSTLAGALAAVKLHIPVGHIEAGLRSFDRTMPEEINRVATDHVSAALYCPTRTAVGHLEREGITHGVHLVGDVMIDAFAMHSARAVESSTVLSRHGLDPDGYWLATIHRPANTDDARNLRTILEALRDSDRPVLLPLHPRTRASIERHALQPLLASGSIIAVGPLSYLDLLAALHGATGVLTDSGGLQKEAYLAGRPCITLRDRTEWVETVDDGWNVLVGADGAKIRAAMTAEAPTTARRDHYGDAKAADRIASLLPELARARL